MSEQTSAPDCIFCRIVSGQIPADIVYETASLIAFNDRAPQAPVHVLVIPRKHIARLAELSDKDAALMGELVIAARDIAVKLGVSDGFRMVANSGASAGQSVFHIHWHLLAGRRMTWPPG